MASPQILRRTSRINVLIGMHLCNTNRPRTANSEQHKPKRMRARKKYFHHLGQGGYKTAIPKWQKMEENLIARGIILATFNWPLRAKYFFYVQYDSSCNEVLFHFLPLRNSSLVTSLAKMMEVFFFLLAFSLACVVRCSLSSNDLYCTNASQ